jgi:hypothetical protein
MGYASAERCEGSGKVRLNAEIREQEVVQRTVQIVRSYKIWWRVMPVERARSDIVFGFAGLSLLA